MKGANLISIKGDRISFFVTMIRTIRSDVADNTTEKNEGDEQHGHHLPHYCSPTHFPFQKKQKERYGKKEREEWNERGLSEKHEIDGVYKKKKKKKKGGKLWMKERDIQNLLVNSDTDSAPQWCVWCFTFNLPS